MLNNVAKLPSGWCPARLRDIIPKPRPKIPADPKSTLPFVGMDHIEAHSFHLIGQDAFSKMKSAGSYFCKGDILYGRLRPYLNKVHRAKFEGVASAEFIVLPESESYDGEFIKYLLHQRSFIEFAMSRSSGDRPRVKFDGLADFEFGLPPLPEQQRIVEKIETLFAQLDKGEVAVREVQELLTRYRQSVLKAAVTGQLTAEWRAARTSKLEHARDLLTRILKARREKWMGRGKYQEPRAPNLTDLPELPEVWVWTNMDALIVHGPQNGIYLPQDKYGDGTPIIRIDDFQTGWVRPVENLRKVNAASEEVKLYSLRNGDFVINRVNSVTHLGKAMLVDPEHDGALFESNMMRMSVSHYVDPSYLELYLSSAIGRKRLIANCKHAVNQASINQGDVESTPVPLPPLEEQREIAVLARERLAKTNVLVDWCETELKRSTSLRQSILKDAFAGKLVPQDPTDEPASALLARTAAAQPNAKKTGRKTPA